jgi:YacP-like NYN domain
MALIYDIELPEAVIADLEQMVDGCEIADLLNFAKRNSDLIRGFQPKASNEKIIRQRIKSALGKNGELDMPVIDFIAEQSLNRQFICVLSLEALQHCFDELMVILGMEPLIIGLLFDKRSEVRELAVDYLDNPHDPGSDLPGARAQLSDKLEKYIDIFSFVTEKRAVTGGVALGGGSNKKPESSVHDQAKIKQLTVQLEESKCNRKEVNILNKKLVNLDQDYQQTQSELEKLKNNFRELKAQNSDFEQATTEARSELVALQRNQAEIVSTKVNETLEQTSYAWLKRPLELDQQLQNIAVNSDNDILNRADIILEKQVEQDRHYGNVRLLNERLQLLQDKNRCLEQAQQESVKPVPELNIISNEIMVEINKLNKTLGLKQGGRNFVDECIHRINMAETASDIAATEAMLGMFNKMKLLPDDALNELYVNYHARLGVMMAQYQPSAEMTDNALWWFYKLLRDNKKVHLLLDGHNILHLLSSIFSPFYDNDIPGAAAREQLVERMINAVATHPDCMVNIFFDGPEPSEYSPTANIKVIYSGGGDSEHRADRVLLSYLQFLAGSGSAASAVIVTDDRDIQNNARTLKAKVMSPIQFAGMLS